jgi:inner membrane protein
MDSVTQFALGATIGAAVLGRRTGLRRAALTGGLLATLPDLDVFWPEDDPVERFVTHRSATHSLVMHVLLTPVLGEGLRRLFVALRSLPFRQGASLAWGMVFLCLATHALLDATTIYGTQLLWPLNRVPYAIGSMFIIDPLYTLPLLIMTLWALSRRQWSAMFGRGLMISLGLSSLYLVWSFGAQNMIEDRGQEMLTRAGLKSEKMIATPMPFNTLLWRVIAVDGDQYYNIYLSVLNSDPVDTYRHIRYSPDTRCWLAKASARDPVRRLSDFSHGYSGITIKGGELVYADLRMGLTPYYVFSYRVGGVDGSAFNHASVERLSLPRSAAGDWPWLRAAVFGDIRTRPVERQYSVLTSSAQAESPKPAAC